MGRERIFRIEQRQCSYNLEAKDSVVCWENKKKPKRPAWLKNGKGQKPYQLGSCEHPFVWWKVVYIYFNCKTYLGNWSIFQELRAVIRGNVMVIGNISYLLCSYPGCLLEIETVFVFVSPSWPQCLAQCLGGLQMEFPRDSVHSVRSNSPP